MLRGHVDYDANDFHSGGDVEDATVGEREGIFRKIEHRAVSKMDGGGCGHDRGLRCGRGHFVDFLAQLPWRERSRSGWRARPDPEPGSLAHRPWYLREPLCYRGSLASPDYAVDPDLSDRKSVV